MSCVGERARSSTREVVDAFIAEYEASHEGLLQVS